MSKFVDLPIDQRYYASLRIIGKQPVPYTSTMNGANINGSIVAVECPQDYLMTYSWQCENGDSINASQVCDGVNDCLTKEDEYKLLCKGSEPWFIRMIRITSLSFYITGFIISFTRWMVTKKKKCQATKISGLVSHLDDIGAELNEAFKVVRSTCKRLQRNTKKSSIEDPASIELAPFIQLYKAFHSKSSIHISKLCAIIEDISEDEKYYKSCAELIDLINLLENQQFHEDNVRGSHCLEKMLALDYNNAERFIDIRERTDFCSNLLTSLKSRIRNRLGNSVYSNVCDYGSIGLCIGMALRFITMFYADIYYDCSFGTALDHIHTNFFQTKDKLKFISMMNINVVKYYYVAVGAASLIAIHIFNGMNLEAMQGHPKSKVEQILSKICMLFPAHTLGIEMTRTTIAHIQAKAEFRSVVKKAMEENDEQDHFIAQYWQTKIKMKRNTDDLMNIRKIFLGVAMLEVSIEGVPQLLVVISLLLSILTTDYGRMKVVFDNVLHELMGIRSSALYAIVLFLAINKFLGNAYSLARNTEYPMSLGLPSFLLILTSSSILLWSRFSVLGILLSTSPHLYPIVAVLEILIIVLVCKATSTPVTLMEQILPCSLSVANFKNAKKNTENVCAKRYPRLFVVASLHYLHLICIYIPVYAVLSSVKGLSSYASTHTQDLHLKALIFYVLGGIVYLMLMILNEQFFRRWKVLKDIPVTQTDSELVEEEGLQKKMPLKVEKETDLIGTGNKKIAGNKIGMVDPIVPESSFMQRNKESIQQKVSEQR